MGPVGLHDSINFHDFHGWSYLGEKSPTKTFVDRVLWDNFGFISCSTKSRSFLGLFWARVGLLVGQTLTLTLTLTF